MSELVMEVKPKFYWFQRAIANIRKEVAITIGLEGLILMLIMVIVIATNNPVIANLAENSQEELIVYLYIIMMSLICLIFPLSVLFFVFLDKKNFEVTSYKVYDDRINFDEGFINHKHSSILFKDIKEIHLDQNFIQKKYNIANIRFITSAGNLNNQYTNIGVNFQDIENVQSVYTKIKEIHEKADIGE